MIEKLLILIIQELGPTGLLVVGLYYFLALPLRKIAHHIEIINHNSTNIANELKEISRCTCKTNHEN